MIEASVVAGYVIAWAVRKARRAAGRLDAEVDTAMDAGLDRLHEVVAAKLGPHPALDDLAEEATADRVSDLTRQQVELAVTAAARRDGDFGARVNDLLAALRAAESPTGAPVVAGAGSRVFTGAAYATTGSGGVAIGQLGGDANLTADTGRSEQPDPSAPGRSRH
ncbi:chromosome partitioning protein [Actinoplanes ianthinogenes]|uniref:chromosome partitioning protein n=1 Tax=Actinoplanes ianthinogenes TaxID=122358 RepID=UPI001FD4B961|nr:chromosome partitioning protein [Actinoplanes ianthinogenes]